MERGISLFLLFRKACCLERTVGLAVHRPNRNGRRAVSNPAALVGQSGSQELLALGGLSVIAALQTMGDCSQGPLQLLCASATDHMRSELLGVRLQLEMTGSCIDPE